ncbi:hypothetical protein HRbin36_01339 [bacterium HR36]|nr:hypothetical protein HRbin36_01339 [bacterium HR36]
MNRHDNDNLSLEHSQEQLAEQWLREFFRQHIPQQLPPLVQLQTVVPSTLHDGLMPATTRADAPCSRAAHWSRLVLLLAIVALSLLLFVAPWLAPKPSPQWRFDPSRGFARDKPNPVPVQPPSLPAHR